MTFNPSSSLADASTYAHPRSISPPCLHPQLGSWTPRDLVHCSNRKLDADFFSSRSLSIHRRIVIRNFLSFLFELQPLNEHHNDSTAVLELNLHPPPGSPEYDDGDNHGRGYDQWMEQTLSAAGLPPSCSDAAPSLAPSSEDDLDLPVLEWMNSSEEPILSRSAAAAASAVTSRRRPQSLRSSRIPLPRPQSTELPQSLHSYLSTVFDVDWSIKSPTTEDALFTNKKSSTTRPSGLGNLSSALSSPLADTTKGLRASPEPELSANSILSVPTCRTQDVHIGLQGRQPLTDFSSQESSIGLCESKSSSKHEEGVANSVLFTWEQAALNRQTSSSLQDRTPRQYSKDEHQRQHQHQHQQQHGQEHEQHIHNHIHIHVHTCASPSPDSRNGSVIYSYSQPPQPQPQSSRYPTQSHLLSPPPSGQRKHQHQQKESYPCIAVAGPLAPQSSSQPLKISSSLLQYPPEKTVSAGHDQLYLAAPTPSSSPEPSRSRYPRSPPPPPYTPSQSIAINTAEFSESLVYPHPMKQAPQAPRHMQSAAARKEYRRYEEQQKMFVRDEEPRETGSSGFLQLLTRQSSKRKSTKVASISAPLSVSQSSHWQDEDHAQSFTRLSLSSVANTGVGNQKGPFSPAKGKQQRPLPPMTHPPSTEAYSYYPSRSAPAAAR